MKRNGMLFTVCCVVFLIVAGTAAAEDIQVVGTGSGMTLLKAITDKFNQENPGANFTVPDSIGSSGGIKAVGTDQYKIGRIARPLKEKESRYGLTYLPFAKMPIVFFTNKSCGVKDLTAQQLCDIYSGKTTDWSEVGGQKGPVRVIRREDGDSSLQVLLKSLPGFGDITLTTKSKTTFNDQETTALAEGKEGTIAFGTLINAKNYDVEILSIDGKKPIDDDYPHFGTLALIFKDASNTGTVGEFIQYVGSPEVRQTIIDAGGLPFSK